MLIKASKLSKNYSEQVVFSNLNFAIQESEFVSILGPSGCGKSTLLKILAQLQLPTSGELSATKDLNLSVIFQEPRLLPWLTALENANLPGSLQQQDASAKVKVLLEQLGLSQAAHKFPHELSGGMKMRVSIARALSTNPELILCDEPFSALDEDTRNQLQQKLRETFEASRKTVVFVTHSLEEACFLSDRILIFKESALKEFIPDLPKSRGLELKSQVHFFNEVQRLRREK
jgi:NitT/TauT family transport system ATP-binding protein